MGGRISRRVFGTLGGALLASSLLGCNFSKNKRDAEREVLVFHRRLDAGDFVGIYADGHADLKAAATEKDFVALLDAVHRKLGSVRSSVAAGSTVNMNNGATTVRLTNKTTFSDGDGVETFIYRIESGKTRLLGYNISSMALITK